ncbi:MAG: MBL fold metallo-hydrolase [Betaproteobacteria bacterium]|nr:MBL fold metallo-hydrolase [Betaproteobacteria bacterium]MDE2208747.1 MBL fold metallo-hydrolase [Betaproteobacteria bacterium]
MEEHALHPPAPGHAVAIAPGVLWLRMPLPFALDHINLWLVAEPDGHTLVDCGYGDAVTRGHWHTHFETTLRDRPIRRIIATHCHPDHLGNAEWLAARFGCTIAMTQAEFLASHALIAGGAGLGQADVGGLFARHGMPAEHLAALAARGNHYHRGVPEAPHTFLRLIDGDRVAAGPWQWEVIAGYGHSPEHASLSCVPARLLISGDMLLPRISTNVAVWPGEPDGDPVARFLSSLSRFAPLPPDTLVLPSHGRPFYGIAERVDALRRHHAERLAELHAALAAAPSSRTASDMIPVLFRRELDLQQRFFAMGEAIAHLNHLWRSGRASREVAPDGTIRYAA